MKINLLTTRSLDRQRVLDIFAMADSYRKRVKNVSVPQTPQIGASLFFQSSTRTRIGFEVAAWKQGTKLVAIDHAKNNQLTGAVESIADTIRTLNPYVDFYLVRHKNPDIFHEIIPHTSHPVINCGNGYDEHPTQALVDAYAIWVRFGRLDNLNITIIGQTKYSRSVHSLLILLSNFKDITIQEVTPRDLRAQMQYRESFERYNTLRWSENIQWGQEQVVYSTGFPAVNPSGTLEQSFVDQYKITQLIANKLAAECIILNPLPRIDEIDVEVDNMPSAYYFMQNEYGLYLRMALIDEFCSP